MNRMVAPYLLMGILLLLFCTCPCPGDTGEPGQKYLTIPQIECTEPGTIWTVKEYGPMGNWDGIWIVQNDGKTLDGSWSDGAITDIIEIRSITGDQIQLHREGNDGTYTGTIASDGLKISGTASWYSPGQRWDVVISPIPEIPTTPGNPGHGIIQTGPSEELVSGQIPPGGGTITVHQPGSPLDGMSIDAGADSWPSGQDVSISSAPVTSHSFGEYFNPATPLITIHAGEGYANEPVLVSIPVKIPEDKFAMAFYYDAGSQQLEGIPMVGQDSESVTIATRHFSDLVVSMIDIMTLNQISTVDSGFKPGVDDWEFTNNGSVVAPGGHCSGQSLTAMWYYIEQKKKLQEQSLFGRYDNNGREKTPCCGNDNTLGYRFASVIQKKYEEEWANNRTSGFFFRLNEKITNGISTFGRLDNLSTFRLFKYSILLSGEPQIVDLRGAGGHEIVCYKVAGDTMYIADPNYPGSERTITLNGSALGPYASGANSKDIQANGVSIYSWITYFAKSSYLDWSVIGDDYKKVRNGEIGDGEFPSYVVTAEVTDDEGKVVDTFEFDGGKNEERRIAVTGKNIEMKSIGAAATTHDHWINEKPIALEKFTLKPGDNMWCIQAYADGVWLGTDTVNLIYTEKPEEPLPPNSSQAFDLHIEAWGDSMKVVMLNTDWTKEEEYFVRVQPVMENYQGIPDDIVSDTKTGYEANYMIEHAPEGPYDITVVRIYDWVHEPDIINSGYTVSPSKMVEWLQQYRYDKMTVRCDFNHVRKDSPVYINEIPFEIVSE